MSNDENKRDRFARLKDAGEFAFAGVLTIYGVLGYYLLRDQLRVMEKQTSFMQKQMKDAETAAKGQAADTARLLGYYEQLAKAASENATSAAAVAEANKSMAEAAKINAENSARLAQSSEQSVHAAREAFRLEQRAWVGIKDSNRAVIVVGERMSFKVEITNTGRTPALDVRTHWHFGLAPIGAPLDARPFDDYLAKPSDSVGTLYPGAISELWIRTPDPLTAEIYEQLMSGRSRIVIRVLVMYKDVFERDHSAYTCWRMFPDQQTVQICRAGDIQ